MIEPSPFVIGIDIGSISISVVQVGFNYQPVRHEVMVHQGKVFDSLDTLLSTFDLAGISYIAATESAAKFIRSNMTYDSQVSIIRAARQFHDHFSYILSVGGEKFSLSAFDDSLKYSGSKFNTSCAAGTGSFLDQQAIRLNLGSSENISHMALKNQDVVPDIATRCSVFAKTDLIHAQQEGYRIEQICDGLCKGMAKNIQSTLFKAPLREGDIIFCGGVSLNNAVKSHLESAIGKPLLTDPFSRVYKAAGAAFYLIDELKRALNHDGAAAGASPVDTKSMSLERPDDLFLPIAEAAQHVYPQLSLSLSDYPDFSTFESYMDDMVEVDIYEDPSGMNLSSCYLGMDVGSTSTKSIIISGDKIPVAGFYTRTASKPVNAVQNLFRAIDQFTGRYGINLCISGCGTTGSGRRISAKIIGADITPDEITAHARAAFHLNPKVDTIIEIGGQDAKFTLLKNGVVTSSTMNTVCAAGTGSFIEEQANKLKCDLKDYSHRTEGVASPVSSDRCTVFMERDLNHFLSEGYHTDQVLASVLHSVRDNYLTKVANVGKIGQHILFQGATAKNKALIAAFEQKLNKPIQVSKYCHLTGALGVALLAMDAGYGFTHVPGTRTESLTDTKNPDTSTAFRGFDLWKSDIPIKKEICQLCNNHCKITIADINGQVEAYGFLCGRDYNTQKYIAPKGRFHLVKERNRLSRVTLDKPVLKDITIGIPAALHLLDDLEFWKIFFNDLGIHTVSSESLRDPIKSGKGATGAEFCAPLTSLHGHVLYLMEKADYIFLPFYFEDRQKEKELRRQHCYYTQFAPSLMTCIPGLDHTRIIAPLVKYLYTSFQTKIDLFKAIKRAVPDYHLSFFDVNRAYDRATAYRDTMAARYKSMLKDNFSAGLNVLFVGRPYTVLSETMNSGIPGIFANLGIPAFFQDMLEYKMMNYDPINPLLKQVHWKYGAQILKAAYIAAQTPNLYPVYITSFKCSPDSFCVDYFKQIMEEYNKPYLVLELDEHDSSVGYETRVEAAIQAFENHMKTSENDHAAQSFNINSTYCKSLDSKTVIFPNWDDYTGRLIVSIMKREGINAVLMEETEATIKQSLLTNTGQCIPLNAVASGFIHTVQRLGLDPSKTALWLNQSDIACNIRMYPHHIKRILEREGNGFETAHIYIGELSLFDISVNAAKNAYFGYMFGGLIKSIVCRIRPYEINKGETDSVSDQVMSIMERAFEHGLDKEKALSEALTLFSGIERDHDPKPKVGIFGDLYIRDNAIINQDLIRFIEAYGGEAVITPYYTYIKIIASSYFKKWFAEGKYMNLISNRVIYSAMQAMEKKYYKYFEPFLGDITVHQSKSSQEILANYGILPEHTGESMDNILKIHHIISEYPEMGLLVQTNPSFCCPALITEAMASKIEEKTGIPIVTITYDISGGNKNRILIPYLDALVQKDYPQRRKASG